MTRDIKSMEGGVATIYMTRILSVHHFCKVVVYMGPDSIGYCDANSSCLQVQTEDDNTVFVMI